MIAWACICVKKSTRPAQAKSDTKITRINQGWFEPFRRIKSAPVLYKLRAYIVP